MFLDEPYIGNSYTMVKLWAIYVSGSSKIQTLMIFIDHVSIKVGVANTHWVIYALVSFIPACL